MLTSRPERVAGAALRAADPFPRDTSEWNRIIDILDQGGMEVCAAGSNASSAMITLAGLDHLATLQRGDLTLPHVQPVLERCRALIEAPAR